MPLQDQFKLGYGGVRGRLANYRITDKGATLVAFTPIDGEKKHNKAARTAEAKLLRETQRYNPNGNARSEMRLNVQEMRDYILNNFEEIRDELILKRKHKEVKTGCKTNLIKTSLEMWSEKSSPGLVADSNSAQWKSLLNY